MIKISQIHDARSQLICLHAYVTVYLTADRHMCIACRLLTVAPMHQPVRTSLFQLFDTVFQIMEDPRSLEIFCSALRREISRNRKVLR
jgi:hypothetical protein